MWSIGEVKERGKAAFKGNYWSSVLAAFLLSLLFGGAGVASRSQTQPEDLQASIMALDPLALGIFAGALGTVGIVSLLLKIFVFNPLQVGCYRFFRKNVEDTNTRLGVIGEGFSGYGHIFITLFLRDLFLLLWTLLFFIPGVIKTYSYRMVPYIIKDNPELSATEVITKSREMMNGHKFKAFLLDLSFIGWIILSIITCGIVWVFWTSPYMENADAALYAELSK